MKRRAVSILLIAAMTAIDDCREIRTINQIVLPIMKSVIAVQAIFRKDFE